MDKEDYQISNADENGQSGKAQPMEVEREGCLGSCELNFQTRKWDGASTKITKSLPGKAF